MEGEDEVEKRKDPGPALCRAVGQQLVQCRECGRTLHYEGCVHVEPCVCHPREKDGPSQSSDGWM